MTLQKKKTIGQTHTLTHMDGHRDTEESAPYVPLCFAGDTNRSDGQLWEKKMMEVYATYNANMYLAPK